MVDFSYLFRRFKIENLFNGEWHGCGAITYTNCGDAICEASRIANARFHKCEIRVFDVCTLQEVIRYADGGEILYSDPIVEQLSEDEIAERLTMYRARFMELYNKTHGTNKE